MQLLSMDHLKKPAVIEFLWKMLQERDSVVNISHKKMPTPEEHSKFVYGRPYKAWYIVEYDGQWVGQIYLTHFNEIGIHLIKSRRQQGLGADAVSELMRKHGPSRFLANIAPANEPSRKMFEGMGFRHIQSTFERDTRENVA